MRQALTYAAVEVSILAVVCAIRTALISVYDNLDTFIGDISRQSRWAMYTAVLAAVATLLQGLDRLLPQ